MRAFSAAAHGLAPSQRIRDETCDLIVLAADTADISEGYGHPGAIVVASYRPSQFPGEIGMLTGQRAFLSAVVPAQGGSSQFRWRTCAGSWRKSQA